MVVRDAFHTGTIADKRLMTKQNININKKTDGLKKRVNGRLKLSPAFIVIISANNIFLKTAKTIKESNKPTIPPTIVNTKFSNNNCEPTCQLLAP